MPRPTAMTADRSASPFAPSGVPTAMKQISDRRTASARSVWKVSRRCGDVAPDQLLEARLVDRHLAAPQRRDLAGVDVDADDVVAALGEAGAGHQTDVPGADDAQLHR